MIMETDTPPDEFDIEALYNNIEPAPPTDESIAQWIVPILDKHKKRILTLSRNSHLATSIVQRLADDLDSKKFPTFTNSIKTPEANKDSPGLQEKWDEATNEYKTKLTQDLITYKRDRAAEAMKLTDFDGQVLENFLKELKNEVQNQIAKSEHIHLLS